MSLSECIKGLVAGGAIPKSKAAEAERIYDAHYQSLKHGMSEMAAADLASQRAIAQLKADAIHARQQKLLMMKAQMDILDKARNVYDGGRHAEGVLPGKALMASLVHDEKARGIANVEYRWRAIKQQALGQMYDMLAHFRADLKGELRNKSDLDLVVRELNGESTGDLNAGEMAKAWTQVADNLRRMFNEAGGRIGKLEGWALPHRHDPERVGAVSAEQWIGAVVPLLDRSRMIDRSTGLPLSDNDLTEMLTGVYENIASDGWVNRNPGGVGGSSMANRYGDHRVLHFKDADSWLGYNERFGQGSAFDAMMGHVERMSRDIASMQILGPNPAATIKWMGDVAEKEAATKGGLRDRGVARVDRYRFDAIWNEIQGQNRRVVNRNLALFGSTLRNWQGSTKLGSAVVASMSDHATAQLTRIYNGLPATQTLGQYLKNLNPLDAGDREFARRAGIIGDEFTGRMAAQGRMHMEDAFGGRLAAGHGRLGEALGTANEFSRRLTDGVLRASGLNAHTLAVREAVGMDFMAALAQFSSTDFDQLNPAFRGFLTRYGLDRTGWDAIRSTPLTDYKGAPWIRPGDIVDRAAREKFMQGMLTEIDFAVPSGGLYTRAMVNLVPPGTAIGELIRTGFQFKMFPVTVMAMHSARAMAQSNLAGRAKYAAAFLGATTLMGALSYQMGEVVKGKDPRPMGDPDHIINGDFLWRSALKGGGLGVFGDAIEFSRNEFGQDVGDITKGPSYGTIQNLATVGKAGIATAAPEWIFPDDPDAVEKAAKLRGKATRDLLTREVPGSSLWYIRAAYERLLVDTVSGWAEGSTVAERYDRMEKRAQEQGQGYWAPPGAGAGGWRAPNLSTAFTAPPQ